MIPVLQYNATEGLPIHPQTLHLVVQQSTAFTGMLLADEDQKQIVYWQVTEHGPQESIAAIEAAFQKLPTPAETIPRTTVISFALDAALLPPMFANAKDVADNLLQLTQGRTEAGQSVLLASGTEPVVYRLPAAVHDALRQRLPAHTNWQHILGLLCRQQVTDASAITLTILLQQFVLCVEHAGKRLLLQQYAYQAPEDILYRVLQAVQALQLDAEQVVVTLQGLVAQESATVQLLQQYLAQVQWGQMQHYTCASNKHMPNPATLALADILLTCAS